MFKLLDRVVVKDNDEVLTVIGSDIDLNFQSSPYYHSSGAILSSRVTKYYVADSSGNTSSIPGNLLTLVGSPRKQLKADLLKMYILVKNTAPIGLGINAVGHATFMAGQTFNSDIFNEWKEKSFRKVTCLVSPEEFDAAISAIKNVSGNYVVFNENDWNDQDLSVAFEPRYSFPEVFKTFKLHSGAV